MPALQELIKIRFGTRHRTSCVCDRVRKNVAKMSFRKGGQSEVQNNGSGKAEEQKLFTRICVSDCEGRRVTATSSILNDLRPLMIAGNIFGACPLKLETNTVTFSWKSWQAWYTLSILILFLTHSCFEMWQLREAFIEEEVKAVKVIFITPWVFCNVLVVATLIVYLSKGQRIANFFLLWQQCQEDLQDDFKCKQKRKVVNILYLLYSTLGVMSTASIAMHYRKDPTCSTYWTSLFSEEQLDGPIFTIGLVFYSVYPIMLMVATSMMEVTVGMGAMNFRTAFIHVDMKLKAQLNQRICSGREWERARNTPCTMISDPELNKKKYEEDSAGFEMKGIRQEVLCAMTRHERVAMVLEEMNGILGPLVLLQGAQYLFMICSLLYVSLRAETRDVETMAYFLVNLTSFVLRLLVLIPCFSTVYQASCALGATFSRLALQDRSDQLPLTKMVLFLQRLTLNPPAISAWGFYIVTLSTLLGFWGTLVTYLVVLLQTSASVCEDVALPNMTSMEQCIGWCAANGNVRL